MSTVEAALLTSVASYQHQSLSHRLSIPVHSLCAIRRTQQRRGSLFSQPGSSALARRERRPGRGFRSARCQSAGDLLADGPSSQTKIRVERQVHLPASGAEVWGALRLLLPEDQWKSARPVFGALESIYRAEYHALGEQLSQAYQDANEALVDSTSTDADERSPDQKGDDASASPSHAAPQSPNQAPKPQSDSSQAKQLAKKGGRMATNAALAVVAEVREQVVSRNAAADNETEQHQNGDSPSTSRQSLADQRTEKSSSSSSASSSSEGEEEDGVTVAQSEVAFEDASRLEYDRRRRERMAKTADRVNAKAADASFMRLLVHIVNKAHYMQLSGRDDSLSRSLNSDYLQQLYISPDTKRLDDQLISDVTRDEELPDEVKSMLVFKRGYGLARRRGRMLVPKLDYLQYIAVKGVFTPSTSESTQTQFLDKSEKQELEGTARRARKRLAQAVKDWWSPRAMVAGGGLFMSLSRWGLIPQVDVLPLEEFRQDYLPADSQHQDPVFIERVSLRDALNKGDRLESLLGSIELVEPTFQELMIVYRKTPAHNWLSEMRDAVMGDAGKGTAKGQLRKREQIAIRLYRDIPVPTWRIVFPDKLLQFRPLDGLRADLFSMAGLLAFIAQAKYDSIVLEIVTFASACVLVVRVVLGYKRMYDRFEQMANEMLANSTVAGQEGTLDSLVVSAALQQFGQAALALLVMHRAGKPLSAQALEQQAEELLQRQFQVKTEK
ncbi:hypothetical protein WJX73_004782 [Symbiochloris irregularis]|uniref:Uncharacterized protein n=1 Tax=Symbiochloris irregularis TaxID=706552 RepID=A0AAW1NKI0_9CHLO